MRSIFLTLTLALTLTTSLHAQLEKAQVQTAIDNGLAWMKKNKKKMTLESYLIYNYLERKFDAPEVVKRDKLMADIKESGEYEKRKIYMRLIEAGTATAEDLKTARGRIDGFTSKALWCDQVELPEGYLQYLDTTYVLTGYYVSHTYLALQWMKENAHPLTRSREFRVLEQRVRTGFLDEFARTQFADDLYIEMVAFLQYAGAGRYVNDDHIKMVMLSQKKDGGWMHGADRKEANMHSTALALWALYEFIYPEKKDLNWIVK